MGSYLSSPVTDMVSCDKNCESFIYGVSSMQGWRISQEDAHNCIPDLDCQTAMFAVYDGHGGCDVAQYCAKNLPNVILKSEMYRHGELGGALVDSFHKLDATLVEEDVISELKLLAGVDENDVDDDEDVPVGKCEADVLRAEANLPLDELLAKYKVPPVVDSLNNSHKNESLLSPCLRSRNYARCEGKSSCENSTAESSEPLQPCCSKDSCHDVPSGNPINDVNNTQLTGIKSSAENIVLDLPVGDMQQDASPVKKCLIERDGLLDNVECRMLNNSSNVTVSRDASANNAKGTTEHFLGLDCQSPAFNDAECDHFQEARETCSPSSNGEGGSNDDMCDITVSCPSTTIDREVGVAPDINSNDDEDDADNDDDTDDDDECDDDDDDVEQWEDISSDEEDEGIGDDGNAGSGDEDDNDDEGSDSVEVWKKKKRLADMSNEEPGSDSGCTACVALLRGDRLIVANAGDSRCVLCRGRKAVDMSCDHKPEDEAEKQRIEKAGGQVTPDGRVNSGLNLSRAIGDHYYKRNDELSADEQMIIALPDIKEVTVEPDDRFLVLACDGIWNSMTSQECIDFISCRLNDAAKKDKISLICEECWSDYFCTKGGTLCWQLFNHCLSSDTLGDGTGCDNMTCIIVVFPSPGCCSAAPGTRLNPKRCAAGAGIEEGSLSPKRGYVVPDE